ncbi:MAG: polysaccharide lyase family 1 protein [Mangrovibacterium sp.]
MKQHALFLKSGHDQYSVFSDKDIKIIKVTNLDKSGEGSLAWAIAQEGPRVIVFEVGGVIDLNKGRLRIGNPYLFIAGQTAPNPGITLIRGGINIATHDVVVQHINVRPGDCGLPLKSGWEVDGLSTVGAYNVLIDHCSFTWATDENLSASGPRHDGADKTSHDITFSNCIIAEGLYKSTHSKVLHSMGTLVHDYCRNIAIVGNLFAHNNQRNPMVKPNASAFIANNLVYNPRDQAIHAAWPLTEYITCPDSMRKAKLTIVGNVLIPAADTKRDLYFICGKLTACYEDNLIIRNIKDHKGYRTEWIVSPDVEKLAVSPLQPEHYHLIVTRKVTASVLKNAGSRPGSRNRIDQRIIRDVTSGKGKVINSQDEVGGYPDDPPVHRQLSVPAKDIEKWLETIII